MADEEVKGLNTFAREFLIGTDEDSSEYIHTRKGQQVSDKALEQYNQQRIQDFINRAGSFTEDLVAFIVDQKDKRDLSDTEVIFGVALATINLRHSYAQPQNKDEQEALSEDKQEKLLKEFDKICWGAQQYWVNNQE